MADIESKRRLRLPRYTIRLRLAVLYGGVFAVSGTLLLALLFLTVRYSSHSAVHSGEGVVARLVERHAHVGGSTITVAPESAAVRQAKELGAVAVNVNNNDLHNLLILSAFALAIMLLASMALGWFLAGRVLRPLQTITSTARAISASNLHERLALKGPNDELRELGDTFDELLGRLESSFEAQRQFVANASHELRTPLTLERAILEVTLADPSANIGTLRAACERVLAIGGQQERMIEALLTLARGERRLERREQLRLQSVLSAVLAERREDFARRGLRLETKLEDAPASGDPRLIERLVANLIDNAIVHNTAGGWVTVTSTVEGVQAIVRVCNSGPAIAPEELEQLTRPFHRLGTARTGHGDDRGHGLGLSIIAAIATAHGATLDFQAQPAGGLQVEVRFPAPGASHV
ncbi:MAG TPA: HAMP domain-containing sensor histidine kinase [Solirubrobacteraceae bacterium]